MPRIPTTPTVHTFVETWSQDFSKAVSKAAGRNQILTVAEAKKLAASTGPESVFADNALSYLKSVGKNSVSVATLTAEMKAYVERAAKTAAGPDGRLSLTDGQKLPANLVDDFFMLRGSSSSLVQARTALTAATTDLYMPSETDAKFAFVSGKQLNGAPITEGIIRSQLSGEHNALIGQLMYVDPSMKSLAKKTTVEKIDASDFLTRLATNVDPNDPASIAQGKRFAELKQTLESQLSDLTVYRFGTIEISTFIVGRTKSGELAGLLTGQVET